MNDVSDRSFFYLDREFFKDSPPKNEKFGDDYKNSPEKKATDPLEEFKMP